MRFGKITRLGTNRLWTTLIIARTTSALQLMPTRLQQRIASTAQCARNMSLCTRHAMAH
jgi:hypothetical protein